MSIQIWTPGHGSYSDSLAMYALCEAACELNMKFQVIGIGGSYRIELDDIPKLASRLSQIAETYDDDILNSLNSFIQRREKGKIEEALHNLGDVKVCIEYLNQLRRPAHALNEGRGRKGETIPLALSLAGKYLTGEFKYKTAEYRVCEACLALLSIGFHYGTIRNGLFVTTLRFDGNIGGEVMSDILGVFREQRKDSIRESLNELPIRTAVQYLMGTIGRDVIKELDEANASWQAIGLRFEKAKGVLQVRGIFSVCLDPIFDGLSRLEDESYQAFTTITKSLVLASKPPVDALEYLYNYLSTRRLDYLAKASRAIYAFSEHDSGFNPHLFDRIIKDLARI